jgi:organic hydroperoxide reductase OsmC/OhrA
MFSQLTRYASELDIPIYNAEMDIRASYDQRGKLGMDDSPSACEGMEYEFSIESPASPEEIKELIRWIDKGCHAANTIRNPVPVSGRVKLNGEELEL